MQKMQLIATDSTWFSTALTNVEGNSLPPRAEQAAPSPGVTRARLKPHRQSSGVTAFASSKGQQEVFNIESLKKKKSREKEEFQT